VELAPLVAVVEALEAVVELPLEVDEADGVVEVASELVALDDIDRLTLATELVEPDAVDPVEAALEPVLDRSEEVAWLLPVELRVLDVAPVELALVVVAVAVVSADDEVTTDVVPMDSIVLEPRVTLVAVERVDSVESFE
jgi:hypothetical protein